MGIVRIALLEVRCMEYSNGAWTPLRFMRALGTDSGKAMRAGQPLLEQQWAAYAAAQ